MDFTIKTAQIKRLLTIAEKFTPKKHVIDILGCIVIEAKNGLVSIKATDMEKRLSLVLKDTTSSDGYIVVSLSVMLKFIKNISSPEVRIYKNENDVIIISSSDEIFELGKGYPIQEYVAFQELIEASTFTIKNSELMRGINHTQFAIVKRNFSPVFTGMFMETKNNEIIFVGTDSYRLSEYKINQNNILGENKLIIPFDSLTGIKNILLYMPGEDINFSINEKSSFLALTYENDNYKVIVSSILISGNFPNYDNEKIVPRVFNGSILFNRVDIKRTLSSVMAVSSENNGFTLINTDGDNTNITTFDSDKGYKFSTKLSTSCIGPGLDILINGKHLQSFVNLHKYDTVKLEYVNDVSPIVITSDDKCHKYIIRPVK